MADKPKEHQKLIPPQDVEVPVNIENAAVMGRLTFFIGNGVSRLYGLPAWDDLANKMLHLLAKNKIINHSTLDLLIRQSTKMKISIADHHFKENLKTGKFGGLSYKDILLEGLTKEKKQSSPIYSALAKCGCKFITTNYDPLLAEALEGVVAESEAIKASSVEVTGQSTAQITARESKKVQIYNSMIEFPRSGILDNNAVFHIHGSLADERTIISSTENYLELYGNPDAQASLKLLFKNQTVVFVGYGLEELELLDLIVRSSKSGDAAETKVQFYLLLPLLSHEIEILDHLTIYFKKLGIEVIPFCRDGSGYHALGEVLDIWSEKLSKIIREPIRIDAINLVNDFLVEFDGLQNEK